MEAHHEYAGARVNDGHFEVLKHFCEALNEAGVEAQKVGRVVNLLETRRDALLNP